MSNLNGSFELLTVEPGIKLAVEQILIDEAKMDSDAIERNLNVLQNLLTLIRYVQRITEIYLSEMMNN